MHAKTSQEAQEAHIAQLQAQIDTLQKTLGPHENAERIVSNHIKLLHRYNEAKDATQILIGRLATLKETTVRQIHIDLDLMDDEDK
ncbi:hypothetical protein BJ138DRAFT_1150253 [Hygrophoropsis aurantiaca]|uniref:Uncharacterized protein n=1 Tax=Hygrophoropsis aurantiaca TaxID=72124 RepID=A0ACB8AGC4_9AGAM|nr:hypothetical protein BJ138DRAFT_1150253 [Hygrophoropsis aurantiaca]